MQATQKRRLTKAGWRVATAAQFLGLTKEESTFIEMKLALVRSLKRRRQLRGLTQARLARQLGTSQSRLAKMESADRTVSIDLLIRALLEMGTSRKDVAHILGAAKTAA